MLRHGNRLECGKQKGFPSLLAHPHPVVTDAIAVAAASVGRCGKEGNGLYLAFYQIGVPPSILHASAERARDRDVPYLKNRLFHYNPMDPPACFRP